MIKMVLIVVALSSSQMPHAQPIQNDEVIPTTPRQIYGDTRAYDGHRVALHGYITNGRCLFQSRRRYQELMRRARANRDDFDPADYDDDAVTIIGPDELPQYTRRLSRRNATVTGRLITNYLNGRRLDLHACGKAAIVVDENDFRTLLNHLRITVTVH